MDGKLFLTRSLEGDPVPCARFVSFTAVKIQVQVFWVVKHIAIRRWNPGDLDLRHVSHIWNFIVLILPSAILGRLWAQMLITVTS